LIDEIRSDKKKLGGRHVLKKSKIDAELTFLAALESGEVVTQARLSKRVAVSVGFVNALLKRAMHKGYVKAKSAPYKRYAYYLTPKGFSEKSRLVAEYLEYSLAFFRSARDEYGELFARAGKSGTKRLVLAGSGDLAEIAILAARVADLEIVGILDRGYNKDQFYRIPVVRSADELDDAITLVITDACTPQQTFDTLREAFPDSQILAPRRLRVTRAPLDFKPKVPKP
jgi:hypothetical protein